MNGDQETGYTCSGEAMKGLSMLPEAQMPAHGVNQAGSRPEVHGSQLQQSGPCERAGPGSDAAFASRPLLQLCPSCLLLPAALPAEGNHTAGPAMSCNRRPCVLDV